METNKTITLKWKNLRWQIAVSDIIYAESYARHISVYTAERKYEVVGKLNDLYAALENCGFVRIHQSFIVNIKHIKCFSSDSVTLFDGTVLPVSERKRACARAKVDEQITLF